MFEDGGWDLCVCVYSYVCQNENQTLKTMMLLCLGNILARMQLLITRGDRLSSLPLPEKRLGTQTHTPLLLEIVKSQICPVEVPFVFQRAWFFCRNPRKFSYHISLLVAKWLIQFGETKNNKRNCVCYL